MVSLCPVHKNMRNIDDNWLARGSMSLDFERCCPIVSNSTALRQNVACDHSMSWWLFAGSSMIILYWWLTYPSEKYESVGMIIPNIWRNKCSKPPTSRAISYFDGLSILSRRCLRMPCWPNQDELDHKPAGMLWLVVLNYPVVQCGLWMFMMIDVS